MRNYITGDTFDAARALLLGELIVPWPTHGALFAVPTRDVLLYAAVDRAEIVGALNVMVESLRRVLEMGAPYGISDQVFWFDGSNFELIPVTHKGNGFGVAPSDRFNKVMFGLIGDHLRKQAPAP